MVVLVAFETGFDGDTVDAVIGVVDVVVIIVVVAVVVAVVAPAAAANAVLVAVVMVVVAAVIVLLIVVFDADSGFGIVVSLLFCRVFLLSSSESVIWSTTSSPHCLSLIGLFSNSMPRNRRAIS